MWRKEAAHGKSLIFELRLKCFVEKDLGSKGDKAEHLHKRNEG
jgi:hypothetical protein